MFRNKNVRKAFICIKYLSVAPVAARSKAWDCCRVLAGIADSNPAGGMDVCLLLSVVCCQVEVSATGRSLVQSSPAKRGVCVCVSECDL
jgi:hypothetical protein